MVVLGVGAAIFADSGVAFADPSETSSSENTSESSAGQQSPDTSDAASADDSTPVDPTTADDHDTSITETAESEETSEESTPAPTPDRPSRRTSRPSDVTHAEISVAALKPSSDDSSQIDVESTSRSAPAVEMASSPPATYTDAPVAKLSADTATAMVVHQETPPPARAVNPIGVITTVVTNVVRSFLNPLAGNGTPDGPFGIPTVWSVLAFVRREFETLFGSPPTADKPASLPATSQAAEVEQRTLILTAFPAEADAILARTTMDANPTVAVDGRHFYLGTMSGKKVIVGMTGIGMVNATQTTEAALAHFTPESGTSINGVVFAGVAGGFGRTQIASVAVPARWSSDDGETWHAVDDDMLAAADGLTVDLESVARLGDPACLCGLFARLPLVNLDREPQLFVGGDGSSGDNNNGTAFPAIPFGGDVFGPQPCSAPDRSPLYVGNFFQALIPFAASGLLSNLAGLLTDVPSAVDAVDMETAAAQQVADSYGIPFLGIRGMSDGPGDPLNLPGYPFTFFVYRQIAADNAAIVTEAFLQQWDATPDG